MTSALGRSNVERVGGRYRLGPLLGQGGMADVYRATDEALDRQVAVKMLRATTSDETDRARFISEARTLASLSHSGLVMVLDAGFDAERPYLVMELVDGPNLAQVCAPGPCDPHVVENVGAQVAETLAFVHAHGIVHRDVKPANVLLGPGGTVKLADFGIARLMHQDANLTRTGFAIGTVAYVSPEQVRGEAVTGASDIYSLGLVLLEALTGRREYDGADIEAARARLLRPPRIPDDLPAPWPDLLRRMTAADPAERPSAAEVARRVRARPTAPIPVTRQMPIDPVTVPLLRLPPSPSSGAWRERLRAVPTHYRALAATFLALVVLVVTAALASDSGGSDEPDLPADTPSDLRGPLADLHDAIHGGG